MLNFKQQNNIFDIFKNIFQFFFVLYFYMILVQNDRAELRHTIGGGSASLLGAVVHELGHLFKLPHSTEGIMSIRGCNIGNTWIHFLVDCGFHIFF